jgi:sarcosine oxidase subunit alpha
VNVVSGGEVVETGGGSRLSSVRVRDAAGRVVRYQADLLAMSGGWNPTVHLFSQSGGKLRWDEKIAAFRPDISVQAEVSVGAAAGGFGLEAAIGNGWRAGGGAGAPPAVEEPAPEWTIEPLWKVDAPGKAFVDFQNDVTAADVELAAREAFVSVEHLKRYTTLGMAPDQGKTSNVNALAIMAGLTGRSIPETGTTRFRFPYTTATLGTLAGRSRGELFRPVRRLPTHEHQQALGADFEEYGGWLRPSHYPRPNETIERAVEREAMAVRSSVGLFEGSPLGKIEVVGPDAGEFLDRIYAVGVSNLKVGKVRYGLMLSELGVVMDDGVVSRLGAEHFLVGTTGAGAGRIADWLEEWRQCEWPDLRVVIAPVTTAWAVLTLSGPKAREVLQAAGVDFDLDPKAFPHMSFRTGAVAGIPARVFRVSFTGEVSFEINVPADRAGELWDALIGEAAPVGVEAWMLLRAEKGYFHVGADTDGATTAVDVAFGRVLKRPRDFVGRRSLECSVAAGGQRYEFVGFEPLGSGASLSPGVHLRALSAKASSEGYVTSAGFSPVLGRQVALGMLKGGHSRHGEVLALAGGGTGQARVTAPGAYDPKGDRLNA